MFLFLFPYFFLFSVPCLWFSWLAVSFRACANMSDLISVVSWICFIYYLLIIASLCMQLSGPQHVCITVTVSGWIVVENVISTVVDWVVEWKLGVRRDLLMHELRFLSSAVVHFVNEALSMFSHCFYEQHTHRSVLRPFFRDHPGEPVPEENFWTLWCEGRLTQADTLIIQLGATPSRLSSAHLHHSPIFLQAGCPSCHPTNSVKALFSWTTCTFIMQLVASGVTVTNYEKNVSTIGRATGPLLMIKNEVVCAYILRAGVQPALDPYTEAFL